MESVLIVDDNADLRELYSIVLTRRAGTKSLLHREEMSAFPSSHKKQPDLVLLDIMMEPVDGWETLDPHQVRSENLARSLSLW